MAALLPLCWLLLMALLQPGRGAAPVSTVVFSAGEGGYYCIKIPYLAVTNNGSLLAFAEARRYDCSDWDWTDLVVKRSTDGGATWGPMAMVYGNSSSPTDRVVIGNAAPVVLRPPSSRVLLPFCRNNLEVLVTYSDDDGLSWAPPRNVSGLVPPEWTWVGLGPPAGLQLASGRLLVPSYYSVTPDDDGELSTAVTLLSDDGGGTWRWGGNFSVGQQYPNECQAVELEPSVVLVHARGLWNSRLYGVSRDGGESFAANETGVVADLVQPLEGCEGSTVRDPATGALFFSGPYDTSIYRYNMSLFVSPDGGASWSHVLQVDPRPSAYSALSFLPDGSLAILYEWQNVSDIIFTPTAQQFSVLLSPAEVRAAAGRN